MLKQEKHCDIRYGRNHYDYQEGTLVFLAPGQVVGVDERQEEYQPTGHALLFHPDLLRGTALGQHLKEYRFFSYSVHEALHLSAQEQEIVLESFRKIDYEVRHALDKHSKRLIVSNIELFLNYCVRFYDRQFITRDQVNTSVLEKFEHLLETYFQSDAPQLSGLPSVAFVADKLHLSANYFGDLVKRETAVFEKMLAAQSTDYLFKNELICSYLRLLLHEGLRVQCLGTLSLPTPATGGNPSLLLG